MRNKLIYLLLVIMIMGAALIGCTSSLKSLDGDNKNKEKESVYTKSFSIHMVKENEANKKMDVSLKDMQIENEPIFRSR